MSGSDDVVHVLRYGREEDSFEAFSEKRVLVVAAGMIAAACGVPCHEVGKHDRTNALFVQVALEMHAMYEAHDVKIKDITQSVLKIFEPSMPRSIQRDVTAAKSSGVEGQLGKYVRRSERLG